MRCTRGPDDSPCGVPSGSAPSVLRCKGNCVPGKGVRISHHTTTDNGVVPALLGEDGSGQPEGMGNHVGATTLKAPALGGASPLGKEGEDPRPKQRMAGLAHDTAHTNEPNIPASPSGPAGIGEAHHTDPIQGTGSEKARQP